MSLTQDKKKKARVRFAESDTGDLTPTHSANQPIRIAPLKELAITVDSPGHVTTRSPLPSPVLKAPPTVEFDVPGDRDYLPLIHQTKMVYDQLLCDKQSKLLTEVHKVKNDYDKQCCHLENVNKSQALEYGVRAQAHLNQLQSHADADLVALHQDYQHKMDKMVNTLDEKWRQDNPDKTVQYKVFLHKQ